MEFPMKVVLCNMSRISFCFCTALRSPFDRRLDSYLTTNPQDPFIIKGHFIIYSQFITDPPVSHIWMEVMDLFDQICNLFIFTLTFTLRIPQPMVIGRTADPKAATHLADRISFCFSQFPDCLIFT